MNRVPRIGVTCAVCDKPIKLTLSQLATRKDARGRPRRQQPPTCSRRHARILTSLTGIRTDHQGRPGQFLKDLVIQHDGVMRIAQRLHHPYTWLQRLMRTDLAPDADDCKALADVSGKMVEEVREIFGGPRIHHRAAPFIKTVRERSSNDPTRTAVIDLIEKQYGSLMALVAAIGDDVDLESLRLWLLGDVKFLQRKARTALARFADFSPSLVARLAHDAKKGARSRALTRERKLSRRKKRHQYSKEGRQAHSTMKKAWWDDPKKQPKRERVLSGLQDGSKKFLSDETNYLTLVIRRAAANFTKHHATATPNDVLNFVCRIAEEHSRQFLRTNLRFDDFSPKAEEVLGEPLRKALRVEERLRLHDDRRIAETIRVLDEAPAGLWETVGDRTNASAAGAEEYWREIRKALGGVLSKRVAMAVLRDANRAQAVLSRKGGRPATASQAF